MQTRITPQLLATLAGREAEQILRSCVHCGFCTATCPTYQLLGDELDGPRGRIYQIKRLLEGAPATVSLQQHLDRCLLCRACETTCPSGVAYGRLLEIGREQLEQLRPRQLPDRLTRYLLRKILPYPKRFQRLLESARPIRRLLPPYLARTIPRKGSAPGEWPRSRHPRRMLLLDGCVQPVLAPSINLAAARVLDRLGISLVRLPAAGCCGAVALHLNDPEAARSSARRNIDAWWPALEAGAEAIITTASGCGLMLKEYDRLLREDPDYATKAQCIANASRDIAEILNHEPLDRLGEGIGRGRRIAFHAPCTLQHGQHLPGLVEGLLRQLGFQLTQVPDAHLCCGSAGSYSILQPRLARQLGKAKLKALTSGRPELIASANIGCLNHLQGMNGLPLVHWIELLDRSAQHRRRSEKSPVERRPMV